MDFKHCAGEYRLVISEDGQVEISNIDGTELEFGQGGINAALYEYINGKTYIYVGTGLWGDKKGLHKIGISRNPERRSKELEIDIVHKIECGSHSARWLEKCLHSRFTNYRVFGEWFRFTDPRVIKWFVETVRTSIDVNEFWNYGITMKPPQREGSDKFPSLFDALGHGYLKVLDEFEQRLGQEE